MTTNVEEPIEVIDRARYRQILIFFAGVIANIIWWDLLVGRLFKGPVRRGRSERYRRMSRRFREGGVDMGGVMIKLGQFLSARVDVLPPEITEELAGLQDEVPPVPFDEIELVLIEELGDVSAHFTHFYRYLSKTARHTSISLRSTTAHRFPEHPPNQKIPPDDVGHNTGKK